MNVFQFSHFALHSPGLSVYTTANMRYAELWNAGLDLSLFTNNSRCAVMSDRRYRHSLNIALRVREACRVREAGSDGGRVREATSTVCAVRLQTPRRLQSTHLRTGVRQGSADYQHLIQTYHLPYLPCINFKVCDI